MRRWIAVIGFATLAAGACQAPTPLAHTHGSAEALAVAVLEALASKDRAALETLALNEQEFRDNVWPDLPAARPERNLPFSFVWGDLHQKSQAALAASLNTYGGRRYHLIRTRFDGASSTYASSRVHRRTVLTVRHPNGSEEEIRVFGSSIEQGRQWKVFSYVVE